MLPSFYACTGCGEHFEFSLREAVYLFGPESLPLGRRISDVELFSVPTRPGWCLACAGLSPIEDIQPLRAFENAYGAVRAGNTVEYPIETQPLDPERSQETVGAYLKWRLGRRHPPRALCCGGVSFQLLDVPQPLLKHAECESGVITPMYRYSSFNGPGLGVYRSADLRVYSGEGELIGMLTSRQRGSDQWDAVPATYALASRDEAS